MTVYIPFGKSCTPASVLKYAGLRHESLPFDWLLADPHLIKQSLDNSFQDWFDADKLTPIKELVTIDATEGHSATLHSSYLVPDQAGQQVAFFAHFDMTDPDLVLKMKKRIARFYEIIDSDEEVIFVTSGSYQNLEDNGLLSYFKRKGKTSFIFLEHIHRTKPLKIKQIKMGQALIIKYSCDHDLNEDALKKIDSIIKTHKQ